MISNSVQLPEQVTPDYQNRIVVVTGHRPNKCGGYGEKAELRLRELAIDWLRALKPRGAISGMALGFDTAIVEACLALKLPYVACIPFEGQDCKWLPESRRAYRTYLDRAIKTIVCSSGKYTPEKMQIRNERMIDLALRNGPGPENSILLALWDGTSGGTKNCLSYAHSRIPTINTWDHYNSRVTQSS
jgi:uncharacterized phage-like protein YoqJ